MLLGARKGTVPRESRLRTLTGGTLESCSAERRRDFVVDIGILELTSTICLRVCCDFAILSGMFMRPPATRHHEFRMRAIGIEPVGVNHTLGSASRHSPLTGLFGWRIALSSRVTGSSAAVPRRTIPKSINSGSVHKEVQPVKVTMGGCSMRRRPSKIE